MKKLFLFLAAIVVALGMMAQEAVDWSKYKHAYVIPTSGVTAQGGTFGLGVGNAYGGSYGTVYGAPTKTINPAETISGKLMQLGYSVLPTVTPEFADGTMIVSYGYTGRREVGLGYASCIIVQFRDAKTQELLTSIETEGMGHDETDDILIAINNAFKFWEYAKAPHVDVNVDEISMNYLVLYLTNLTPDIIKSFTLRLTYLKEEMVVHEQLYTQNAKILQGDKERVYIKRDKIARDKKLQVKVDVLGYN